MTWMIGFVILFLESFLVLAAHVSSCHLSCFTHEFLSSGSSTDLLTKSTMDLAAS